MSRTPDQDAEDGLLLATELLYSVDIGGVCLGHSVTDVVGVWVPGADPDEGLTDLTPDEADSLARVLQAWAARTREQAGPTMPADPWKETT